MKPMGLQHAEVDLAGCAQKLAQACHVHISSHVTATGVFAEARYSTELDSSIRCFWCICAAA